MSKQDIVPEEAKVSFNSSVCAPPEQNLFRDNEIYYRFQIAKFIMENNLSFSVADKLSKLLKDLHTTHTPEVIPNFTVNRNDVSVIAGSSIGPCLQADYFSLLENRPFSLSIDGGSAKGTVEYLAINARYLAKETDDKTTTKLLGIIEMGDSYTGATLYETIQEFLFSGERGSLRKLNFMGISADHASNMISKLDAGATNRLKSELPHIEVIHDLCHALNLIQGDCISNFPKQYKKYVEKIAAAFSKSPQRAVKLKNLIKNVADRDDKVCSIKRYVPTRWSSFKDCLERIVELSRPLKLFFDREKIKSCDQCFDDKGDNELMLQLLLCLINELDIYIKAFQTENKDISEIVKDLKHCVVTFGVFIFNITEEVDKKGFLKYDRVYRNLIDLSTSDETKLRTKDQFKAYFLHKFPEFEKSLQSRSAEYCENFFNAAFKFFKTGFEQMKIRFPLSEDHSLMLADCFLLKDSSSLENLRTLARRFTNIIPTEEYRSFCSEVKNVERCAQDIIQRLKDSKGCSWLSVWRNLRGEFNLIYKLACAVQVLPYSTASIERTFSATIDIKTVKRNRIAQKALQGCLLMRQEVENNRLVITSRMLTQYEELIENSKNNKEKHPDVTILKTKEELKLLDTSRTSPVASNTEVAPMDVERIHRQNTDGANELFAAAAGNIYNMLLRFAQNQPNNPFEKDKQEHKTTDGNQIPLFKFNLSNSPNSVASSNPKKRKFDQLVSNKEPKIKVDLSEGKNLKQGYQDEVEKKRFEEDDFEEDKQNEDEDEEEKEKEDDDEDSN